MSRLHYVDEKRMSKERMHSCHKRVEYAHEKIGPQRTVTYDRLEPCLCVHRISFNYILQGSLYVTLMQINPTVSGRTHLAACY